MTTPVSPYTRVHSAPPRHHHRGESTRADEPKSKLARDFYTHSMAMLEISNTLKDENTRIIALIERCNERLNNLSDRVSRLEAIVEARGFSGYD